MPSSSPTAPQSRLRGDQDPRIADLLAQMSEEAARGGLDIDQPVYDQVGLPVTTPVLMGSGSLDARVGFFGRDPGRTEIELREPFIGRGGSMVRDAIHRARFGGDAPDTPARTVAGQAFFWANTVPFKPTGNKAWSVKVKRRFVPFVRTLLVDRWDGTDLITFGNVAFDWFRLAFPHHKATLRDYWARDDRYEATLALDIGSRTLRLRPLPHPSPLNATWYSRLPEMLDQRLAECGVDRTY
jgi:uracil-DNA glycosylase